ncbi:MAG: nucleotidyl transferase AbiEii/AbiGii toxin family protein [Pauljensenia sp.]
MTQRPTNDIDLFTVMHAATRFPNAVDSLIEHLAAHNYDVTVERATPSFAQLSVTPPDGAPLSVDLAIDWRAHTPVRLDIGPVLDLADAVGNKLSALYSRSYPRDYLDVDAIRSTRTITDARLIELLQERDAGFDEAFFAECLRGASDISLTQVAAYGINGPQLHALQQRFRLGRRHRQSPQRIAPRNARRSPSNPSADTAAHARRAPVATDHSQPNPRASATRAGTRPLSAPSSRSCLRRASARVTVVRCAPKVDAICSCVIPA